MSDNLPLLVFGAHPDDIEFGCGGVVFREVHEGRQVHMIVGSRGEAGSAGTPEIRSAECAKAATILGSSLEFIELGGDAHIRSSAEHAITLAGVIRRIRPGVVMAPSLGRTPVGQRTPLTVSGAEAAGVTPAVFLKSKVSTWLGAPAIKMKMTLVALLMVVMPWLVQVPD